MKVTSIILAAICVLFIMREPLLCQTGTFTVHLPKVGYPPDEEGQGWSRPLVWGDHHTSATDDSINVPNGRPIYALIVAGYSQNRNFDELLLYKFAKHLMERGAYVHYAWWNNLLAPYMERPLHHPQSYPGALGQDFLAFTTAEQAANKALPGEDYQFVADAKLLLSAIRQHNPNAIIILAGHSLGGGSIVHLASPWNTNERIDILAPIDPVGNRNYPWAGGPVRLGSRDYNWTRWRITRSNFLGYKSLENAGTIFNPNCVPTGNWLSKYYEAKTASDVLCVTSAPYIHPPVTPLTFGTNVVHLYHRMQTEYLFPFDYSDAWTFGHTPPPGFTMDDEQAIISTKSNGSDPGGWPNGTIPALYANCATGDGVGWPKDGHGEIVGHRGPIGLNSPVPRGVRVRTSPSGGTECPNQIWPARYKEGSVWFDPSSSVRRAILIEMENLPVGSEWIHRPPNPNLCLVSPGLMNLFDGIVTSVSSESQIPKQFILEQNYPNPFNPSTNIKYSVPISEVVQIKVFDVLGTEIKTLLNEYKQPGTYEIVFDGSGLQSGVYFCRIFTGNFIETKKMILLK